MLLDMSVSAMNSEVREISKGWLGGDFWTHWEKDLR